MSTGTLVLRFPVAPMRLGSIPEPFDDPDWIYELKYDAFRSVADLSGPTARRVTVFVAFDILEIKGRDFARCP